MRDFQRSCSSVQVLSNLGWAEVDSLSYLRNGRFPRAWRFKPPGSSRLGERRDLVRVLLARSAGSGAELDDVERRCASAILRDQRTYLAHLFDSQISLDIG